MPAPPTSPTTRPRSGRVFVIAVVVGLLGFVAFLVLASPRLLAWTLDSAPPPAPHQVAAGTLGGEAWELTGVEGDGEEVPCFAFALGDDAHTACGPTRGRGEPINAAELHARGDDGLLVVMTASSVGDVEVTSAAGTAVHEPSFVDFGFPIGYLALDLPAGPVEVVARDRDGTAVAAARCEVGDDATDTCEVGEAG